MGLTNFLTKIFGSKSDKDIKAIMPMVKASNEQFERLKNLDNDKLRAKTAEFKERIQRHIEAEQQDIKTLRQELEQVDLTQAEGIYDQIDQLEKAIDQKIADKLQEILPEAFAVVKETARRFASSESLSLTATPFDRDLVGRGIRLDGISFDGDKAVYSSTWTSGGTPRRWDMVHYDVQLIGGHVLHEGKIAEMGTGEGKTLVATLPVYLNALPGLGVHVVTVNDYLAKRDSEWMSSLFNFHGMTVDCIDKHPPNSPKRRAAYQADVTYGTNNEFGFDYLRDNMALTPEELVQRKHNYAIVDEVDSVLIDDARTPLIISGPVPRGDQQQFDQFKERVANLVNLQRKLVAQIFVEAKNKIKDGDNKLGGLYLFRAYKGFPKTKPLIKFLSEPGMKTLLQETENIYIAENEKRMPEATDELYFVINEKNRSVELTDKGLDEISSGTGDDDFFVLPELGSLLAELDKQALSPLEKAQRKDVITSEYAIKSERIHTVTQLLKAYCLFEIDVDYVVMENKVKIVDEQTGRIMEGRRYSHGLHQALEAKENVRVEAATQTYATITLQNYFRMYKKLSGMTGTAETEAGEFWDIYKLDVVVIPTNRPIQRADNEDLVYRTAREKYNAVITEVAALVEKGRPVLVGTTSVEISELLSKMLNMRKIRHNVLNAKLHQREAEIVAEAGQPGVVTIATNMAGRGTDIKITPAVKAAGGLAIIGTERHESRRVDRQLRGRSGRQGDPGSSQFFVSLEDSLMRLFGSDRVAKLMDRIGLEEGEVIQHKMITNSIERAQKKVEENNFGIRKRLLEFDDVMNSQREVIYKQRRHALHGERLDMDIANMMFDACEALAAATHGQVGFAEFQEEVLRQLSMSTELGADAFKQSKAQDLAQALFDEVVSRYKAKMENIARMAMPVIQQVHAEHGERYKRISVPLTDGRIGYNATVDLEEALRVQGRNIARQFEKIVVLRVIDTSWKEHLRELDELKQSVNNARWEQKDPLLIYKFESFDLFKKLIEENNQNVVATLLKAQLMQQDPQRAQQQQQLANSSTSTPMPKFQQMQFTRPDPNAAAQQPSPAQTSQQAPKPQEPKIAEKRIGRNDPCPCGSGKKYKQCHGKVLHGGE